MLDSSSLAIFRPLPLLRLSQLLLQLLPLLSPLSFDFAELNSSFGISFQLLQLRVVFSLISLNFLLVLLQIIKQLVSPFHKSFDLFVFGLRLRFGGVSGSNPHSLNQ